MCLWHNLNYQYKSDDFFFHLTLRPWKSRYQNVFTCQWHISMRSLKINHLYSWYRLLVLAFSSVCMLERSIGRIMGRFRSWETENMFLSMSFLIIRVNQEHTDSHSMHSLNVTKFLFYTMLQRDQPGRFGIYLTTLLLFLEAN